MNNGSVTLTETEMWMHEIIIGIGLVRSKCNRTLTPSQRTFPFWIFIAVASWPSLPLPKVATSVSVFSFSTSFFLLAIVSISIPIWSIFPESKEIAIHYLKITMWLHCLWARCKNVKNPSSTLLLFCFIQNHLLAFTLNYQKLCRDINQILSYHSSH